MWSDPNGDPFQKLLRFNFRLDNLLPTTVMRSPIMRELGPTSCMMATVLRVLQHHTPQSVFDPRNIPFFDPKDVPDSDGRCHTLIWLLIESTWQLAVASLNSKLQRLRRTAANEAGDKVFPLLKDFRRQISDAGMLIAEIREHYVVAVREAESWLVDGNRVDVEQFWSQERSGLAAGGFGRAQSMDIRNIPDSFKRLEERINAMTQIVNEEIQVLIGSVQVDDAKIMKRQTEWMVVLALLAAIYLPMTLVTGIFGMNIIEITTTEGAPTKWPVVKAWGVVIGATVGCILVYALCRWIVILFLDRRGKLSNKLVDLEARKTE